MIDPGQGFTVCCAQIKLKDSRYFVTSIVITKESHEHDTRQETNPCLEMSSAERTSALSRVVSRKKDRRQSHDTSRGRLLEARQNQ